MFKLTEKGQLVEKKKGFIMLQVKNNEVINDVTQYKTVKKALISIASQYYKRDCKTAKEARERAEKELLLFPCENTLTASAEGIDTFINFGYVERTAVQ